MLTRGIAFIIDPHAEGLDELLAYDGYSNPDVQAFVRLPSGRAGEDTAAILGGLPRRAIAGILADDRLIAQSEVVPRLHELFPNVPVLDHNGGLH